MHFLIDGHNLIGQMPNLRLADPDDEIRLVEYLRSYRAKTGHQLTVIFDAGPGYSSGQTKKQGGVTIRFVRSGQTADQALIRRLRRVKNPPAFMVVSSDRAVQRVAQQVGVRVLAANEFARQLAQPAAGGSAIQDEGSQADVKLSPEEIDEWLELFKASDS